MKGGERDGGEKGEGGAPRTETRETHQASAAPRWAGAPPQGGKPRPRMSEQGAARAKAERGAARARNEKRQLALSFLCYLSCTISHRFCNSCRVLWSSLNSLSAYRVNTRIWSIISLVSLIFFPSLSFKQERHSCVILFYGVYVCGFWSRY